MRSISEAFVRKGRKALIGYVMAGYPSNEATMKAVALLAESGCDIVELGIPFSDPLADGATIQNAGHRAILNGVTPKMCLVMAGELGKIVDIPLVLMTYLNPVMSFGIAEFCAVCAHSSVSGLIIPDLPPDEASKMDAAAFNNGIDMVYLVPPTVTPERAELIARKSQGFIYMVSVTGVTGTRTALPRHLDDSIAMLRGFTDKPLCVGFGISTPAQARAAAEKADGVIIGSKIIQLMEEDPSLAALRDFVVEVRKSLDD